MNWFECKISYEKMMKNGLVKKVTESYLVDALSFTEAEARIVEEMKPYVNGVFALIDIKLERITELFFNEGGDRYYKAKVILIDMDENRGAGKKTALQMLVQASDIKEAIAVLETGMKGTLADYVIASVSESQILDIFHFPRN